MNQKIREAREELRRELMKHYGLEEKKPGDTTIFDCSDCSSVIYFEKKRSGEPKKVKPARIIQLCEKHRKEKKMSDETERMLAGAQDHKKDQEEIHTLVNTIRKLENLAKEKSTVNSEEILEILKTQEKK